MSVKVLFFATLKERAGVREIILNLEDGSRVRDLKWHLGREFPSLTPALETALVAVNREFAFDDDFIPAGAEVALFPPVSGGLSSG